MKRNAHLIQKNTRNFKNCYNKKGADRNLPFECNELFTEVSFQKPRERLAVASLVMKIAQKPLYIAILFENTHLTHTVTLLKHLHDKQDELKSFARKREEAKAVERAKEAEDELFAEPDAMFER